MKLFLTNLWKCTVNIYWKLSKPKNSSLPTFNPGGQHFKVMSGKASLRKSAAAAKSLQSCPTLCDPIDCSPPGSPVPRILQARTLEWVAISFSLLFFVSHLQLITWPDQFHLLSVSSGISAATTSYPCPPLSWITITPLQFIIHLAVTVLKFINLFLLLTYSQLSGFLPPAAATAAKSL